MSRFLDELGPIEWLFVWGLVLGLPLLALWGAFQAVRKRERGAALVLLVVTAVLALPAVVLLRSHGALMAQRTLRSTGIWLVSAAVCVVALPFALLGAGTRRWWEYARRGYRGHAVDQLARRTMWGYVAIPIVALVIRQMVSGRIATYFLAAAGILIVLGWFGRALVPWDDS